MNKHTSQSFIRNKSAKYTLLTFLPLNFLEQFRRVANVYFLIVLFLAYAMHDSPIDPNTWVMSVVFVFGITMIKQGYEDLQRHLNDRYFSCLYSNITAPIIIPFPTIIYYPSIKF